MPTLKSLPALFAACLLAVAGAANAQTTRTIYKWTDENGVVHYEMRKPADQSTEVEVIKKRVKEEPAPQAPAASGSSESAASASTAANEQPKPKKDPKICELAKSNLEQLQNRRRVMTTDAYGNEIELDEKAVANEIKRAQDAIKANCN